MVRAFSRATARVGEVESENFEVELVDPLLSPGAAAMA